VRNYLDWVLSLPWASAPRTSSTSSSRARLDDDHYASRRSRSASSSTWPCRRSSRSSRAHPVLVALPRRQRRRSRARSRRPRAGTSCAVAGRRADGEIRGHRAVNRRAAGKIIQSIKKAARRTRLPPRRDRQMSTDFRGDPSSALLEVLDPSRTHVQRSLLDLDYDCRTSCS